MPPARGTGFSRGFTAMRHPNYRLFFFGQSVSLVGTWITRIASSWYRLFFENDRPPRFVAFRVVQAFVVHPRRLSSFTVASSDRPMLVGDVRIALPRPRHADVEDTPEFFTHVTELRRQPGKRALQGLRIGALVGTVAVLVSCGDCGEYSGMFTLAGAGIGAAFGAPIGAAVGASQRHERVLFRAPVQPATRTFIVTPFGSKQGTGVRVAVRF